MRWITRSLRVAAAAGRLGLRPRRPLALVCSALAIGGMAKIEAQWARGAETLSTTQARFIRGPLDDDGRYTYVVGALEQDWPSRPTVYLLGGSSMRECIASPATLSREMAAVNGRHAGVVVLAGHEQHYAETLTLIDNLPPTGGVVVIDVHHAPFSAGPRAIYHNLTGYYVPMKSAALHDLAVELDPAGDNPTSIWPGIVAYVDSYRSRRGVDAFDGAPVDYREHRYSHLAPLTPDGKLTNVANWVNGRGRGNGPFFANFDLNAFILRRCVEVAQAKGFAVVLMETPQDQQYIGHAWDEYRSMYREAARSIAADTGATYVNLNLSAGLVDADFYDLVHLYASGQAKWTPRVAKVLAPLLPAD